MKITKFTRLVALLITTTLIFTSVLALNVNAETKKTQEANITIEATTKVGTVGKDGDNNLRESVSNEETPTIVVAVDGDRNVLAIPGNTTLKWTGFGGTTGSSPVVMASIEFKAPSLADGGTIEMFRLQQGWGTGSEAEGIKIKADGIYGDDLNVAPDGSDVKLADYQVKAGDWYTLERYFDFREKDKNMTSFVLKKDGDVVAQSGWVLNSEIAPYGSTTNTYNSLCFRTTDFASADVTNFDNLQTYYYTNYPAVTYSAANVNPNVNSYIKYDNKKGTIGFMYGLADWGYDELKTILASDTHNWKQSVMLSKAQTNDMYFYPYREENGLSDVTDNYFLKLNKADGKLYYRTNTDDVAFDNFNFEVGKWYDMELTYHGEITKDSTVATATYDIVIKADGATVASQTDVTCKTMKRNSTQSRLSLGFVTTTGASDGVCLDNVKWTSSNATSSFVSIDTDFNSFASGFKLGDECDTDAKTTLSVLDYLQVNAPAKDTGLYIRNWLKTNYTSNSNAYVYAPCILDLDAVPVGAPSVKFSFGTAMTNLDKNNILVKANNEVIDYYTVTASEDNTSAVVAFTRDLDYGTTYTISFKNTVTDSYGIALDSTAQVGYSFTTEAVDGTGLNVADFVLTETAGDGTDAVVSGDSFKATASLVNQSTSGSSYAFVIAVYDGNKIVDIKYNKGVLTSGANLDIESPVVSATANGQKVRAYLWNSLNGMLPLADSVVIGE